MTRTEALNGCLEMWERIKVKLETKTYGEYTEIEDIKREVAYDMCVCWNNDCALCEFCGPNDSGMLAKDCASCPLKEFWLKDEAYQAEFRVPCGHDTSAYDQLSYASDINSTETKELVYSIIAAAKEELKNDRI